MLGNYFHLNAHGLLHINKNYFMTGEKIWIKYYSGSNHVYQETGTLFFALLKIEDNYQILREMARIKFNGIFASGYMEIDKNLQSGNYLVCVFKADDSKQNFPLIYQYIFIYNSLKPDFIPLDSNSANVIPENMDKSLEKINSDIPKNINETFYQFEYELPGKYQNPGSSVFMNGVFRNNHGIPMDAEISVSVVDARFIYDGEYNSSNLINESAQDIIGNSSNNEIQENINNKDHGNLMGKLLVNEKPAAIVKVYLFAMTQNKLFSSNYITNEDGLFKFPDIPIEGDYEIKLLTLPEIGKEYQFNINSESRLDSIYHINLNKFPDVHLKEYITYAEKCFQIKQSYANDILSPEEKSPASNIEFPEPSHTIILEKYISFNTLAEVIREIIPQVTVKYKAGEYSIRIWDQRGKNFCCKGNPLILVGNNPFLDTRPVMDLKPKDIHSIEVFRPIEAIHFIGDLGINGILRINLNPGIKEELISERGAIRLIVTGFQVASKFRKNNEMALLPDFSSFLYWSDSIKVNENGEFSFSFQNSNYSTEYVIIIKGMTEHGYPLLEKIYYRVKN